MIRYTLAAVAFSLIPLAASADPPAHHRPPQEAIDACAKAKAGDTCSVTFHGHTLEGTCEALPDSSTLACRPTPPPIPPEAIDACSGKSEGDACTVEHDGHSMSGHCDHPPGGDQLACRPDGPPPQRR